MTKKRYVNAGVVYSRKTQYLKHEYFIFTGVKETRKKMSDVAASQQMKEIPDKQESKIMNFLKRILTGVSRRRCMEEELREAEEEFWRIYDEIRERKKKEKAEKTAWKRLIELSWGDEADYIYQHRNLDGISQEWIDEVKRLFEIAGINSSDEDIVREISVLSEQIY